MIKQQGTVEKRLPLVKTYDRVSRESRLETTILADRCTLSLLLLPPIIPGTVLIQTKVLFTVPGACAIEDLSQWLHLQPIALGNDTIPGGYA